MVVSSPQSSIYACTRREASCTNITFQVSYEVGKKGLIAKVSLFLVSSTISLTPDNPPLELIMGLERLLSPLKDIGVPVSLDLAMMMLVSHQVYPYIKTEAESRKGPERGRGIDLSMEPYIERGKNIPVVLVPLIYSSFRRADDLAIAMVSGVMSPVLSEGSLKEMRLVCERVCNTWFYRSPAYIRILHKIEFKLAEGIFWGHPCRKPTKGVVNKPLDLKKKPIGHGMEPTIFWNPANCGKGQHTTGTAKLPALILMGDWRSEDAET